VPKYEKTSQQTKTQFIRNTLQPIVQKRCGNFQQNGKTNEMDWLFIQLKNKKQEKMEIVNLHL